MHNFENARFGGFREDHPGRKERGEDIRELLSYAKECGFHPVRGTPNKLHAMIKVRY